MGNTLDKVLDVAKAELGYLEKKSNSQLDSKTANAGRNNYTKYWRDMKASGYQTQPWCQCYTCWCFMKAYGEKEAKKLLHMESGWSYYTPTAAGYFKNNKQWYTSPKAGDVIYFKNSSGICHVGIVYKVDSSYVYTYEGNTSGGSTVIDNGGGVFAKKYPLKYEKIAGYGRPKYDTAKTTTTTKKTSSKPTSTVTPQSSTDDIKWLQTKLNACLDSKYKNLLSNKELKVDGKFGAQTSVAISYYWKQLGWDKSAPGSDGFYHAGAKTIDALADGKKK